MAKKTLKRAMVLAAGLGELGEPAEHVGEVLEVVVAGAVPGVEEVLAQRVVTGERPAPTQLLAQRAGVVVMSGHRPIEPHGADHV